GSLRRKATCGTTARNRASCSKAFRLQLWRLGSRHLLDQFVNRSFRRRPEHDEDQLLRNVVEVMGHLGWNEQQGSRLDLMVGVANAKGGPPTNRVVDLVLRV